MELLNCHQNFFHQIYTIHLELHGFAPPCVYVLLPNKTEKTYNRMIELLGEKNEPQLWQNTGRLRKGSAECFQPKLPPVRNYLLLFPPDEILLLRKFSPEFNLAL